MRQPVRRIFDFERPAAERIRQKAQLALILDQHAGCLHSRGNDDGLHRSFGRPVALSGRLDQDDVAGHCALQFSAGDEIFSFAGFAFCKAESPADARDDRAEHACCLRVHIAAAAICDRALGDELFQCAQIGSLTFSAAFGCEIRAGDRSAVCFAQKGRDAVCKVCDLLLADLHLCFFVIFLFGADSAAAVRLFHAAAGLRVMSTFALCHGINLLCLNIRQDIGFRRIKRSPCARRSTGRSQIVWNYLR